MVGQIFERKKYLNAPYFYPQIVSCLLQVPDLSINTQTPDGVTALMVAADQGHHHLVRMLLQQEDVDVNIRDKKGEG